MQVPKLNNNNNNNNILHAYCCRKTIVQCAVKPSNHLTRTRCRTTHWTLGRLSYTVISLMEVGERRLPPGCDNEGSLTAGPTVDVTVQILYMCLYSKELRDLCVVKLEVTS